MKTRRPTQRLTHLFRIDPTDATVVQVAENRLKLPLFWEKHSEYDSMTAAFEAMRRLAASSVRQSEALRGEEQA